MSNGFLTQLEHKLMNPEPDLSHLTAEEQNDRILDKVATWPDSVITRDELLERLRESKETGEPLKAKLGIDPTGRDIHLGHLVPLRNLRLLQRLGHKIFMIVGDFTGKIGDPSGRSDERPALTDEQIMKNMSKYSEQASKVLDIDSDSVEQYRNGSWLEKVSTREWVTILRDLQVNEILQRNDFRTRLDNARGLTMAEFLYPIFMGFDSLFLKPDIEIGGMDQYLNMQIGRQMMANAGIKPQMVISYNLLPGIHGTKDDEGRYIKMGKSLMNHIPVLTEPKDMYGKILSISDDVMWIYFRELTDITGEELEQLKSFAAKGNEKATKQMLARVVVTMLHGRELAMAAEEEFNKGTGKNAEIQITPLKANEGERLLDVLRRSTGNSGGYFRRLLKNNGIRVDDSEITEDELLGPADKFCGSVIKVGNYYYRLEA